MAGTGKTSATVAATATRKGVLNSNQTTVIGVYGPENAMRAMIWMPGGRIRTVKAGERLAWGVVVAIDAKGLMLQTNGATTRMSLPEG